jgi:hypothetical protein
LRDAFLLLLTPGSSVLPDHLPGSSALHQNL